MRLRVDVIADTSWAAEGVAAALQRGTQAAVAGGLVALDVVVVRSASLERWLAEVPAPAGHELEIAEVVIVLLSDASFGVRVLRRLPASTPVLWLHPTSEGFMETDAAPD